MVGRSVHVSMIASYLPRQCGIATFTNDLATNLADEVYRVPLAQNENVRIVAMSDREDGYQYGPQVQFQIRQHQRSDYRNAADFLNTNNTSIVNLQHEYGLFGGPDGAHIIELLERLDKPVVSTFHTVLSEPSEGQREVLNRISQLSDKVVVLAERAHALLQDSYDVPAEKIQVIHHGTPDIAFHDPAKFKARFMVKDRPVILTFGLLGPSKGIESMLDALAMVVTRHPKVAYLVLGATHPGVKRESGESYRLGLEQRAVDLGIANNVFFHNHYVTLPVLVDFLKAADLYVTPYRSKEQIVSGTLAFAVACGKAVVSTPYWYAQEMLAEGRGRLVEFDDPKGLAQQINLLLENDSVRLSMRKKAYAFGRQMIWPAVAKEYDAAFKQVLKRSARVLPGAALERRATLRLSLPEVRLDHLYRLTDDTGILQHAIYSTPNRNHGYCTDDNARGLLVAAMSYRLLNDPAVLPYLDTYLSFLVYAWNEKSKRFRNFLSYDRKWLDEDGTEDCLARAILALGYLTSHPVGKQDLSLAGELFHRAAESTKALTHPRAQALCIVGFHYYLRRYADASQVKEQLGSMAQSLFDRYNKHRADDWEWFEDKLTYNNARLPQAMILAGQVMNEPRFLDCGTKSLRWLLRTHSTSDGVITLVGNAGWWPKGGQKARFDQQPIDAAALTSACKSAFKVTGEDEWLSHMRRCFEWFMGKNELGAPLVDFKTKGCCDGLAAEGVNVNQGAESTLSWLLSLLIMYEMHPGQPPTVGEKTT